MLRMCPQSWISAKNGFEHRSTVFFQTDDADSFVEDIDGCPFSSTAIDYITTTDALPFHSHLLVPPFLSLPYAQLWILF